MWPASCGISATGLCMRSTMSRLTHSRSAATSAVNASSDARPFLLSSYSTSAATRPYLSPDVCADRPCREHRLRLGRVKRAALWTQHEPGEPGFAHAGGFAQQRRGAAVLVDGPLG